MSRRKCITPFMKQCFVATGPALNMAGATMLLAYPSGMILQLKTPDSEIPIDRSTETWIVALPSVSGLLGSILAAIYMSRCGRWVTQIASVVSLILGWLIIDLAASVPVILIGRFFHGLAMGSSLYFGPILAAEYLSPKYRGSQMMFAGLLSGLFVLLIQATSLYLHWRDNAVICSMISLIGLPIAIFSPESPTWLASKQRYEECRRAFTWLRGDDEEEELDKMIKASEISHKINMDNIKIKSEMSIRQKLMKLKAVLQQKAFYMPIFIMIHVYLAGQWSGANLYSPYVFDLIESIVGKGYNHHVMGLNINRVVGAALAMYIISKTKRRTMFFGFFGASVAVMFLTAVYTYIKYNNILTIDHPAIGLILMHLHMFFITTCTLPFPYVIAGEIFPLKYKSVAGGFSIVFGAISTSVYVKTFPYLLNSIGLYGAYIVYISVMTYGLFIAFLYLPETKGRTLLEIEEEITGEALCLNELEQAQVLLNK